MVRRRKFLYTVGVGSTLSIAGCSTTNRRSENDGYTGSENGNTDSEESNSDSEEDNSDGEEDNSDNQEDNNLDDSEDDDGNGEPFPLPGDPIEVEQGELSILDVSGPEPETSTAGFNSGDAVSEFNVLSVDVNSAVPHANITLAATQYGSGHGSMVGSAAFQTAWQAPSDGEYRIKTSYLRSDYYEYEAPKEGSVGVSMDSHLVVIRQSDSTTISRTTQPDLRHRRNQMSDEALEMFIETGATLLLGKALGLGLIARQVLGLVLDQLIEIESEENEKGITQYDFDDPNEISTTFTANAGELFVFEYNAMNALSFELHESDGPLMPFSETNVEPQWFYIEPV